MTRTRSSPFRRSSRRLIKAASGIAGAGDVEGLAVPSQRLDHRAPFAIASKSPERPNSTKFFRDRGSAGWPGHLARPGVFPTSPGGGAGYPRFSRGWQRIPSGYRRGGGHLPRVRAEFIGIVHVASSQPKLLASLERSHGRPGAMSTQSLPRKGRGCWTAWRKDQPAARANLYA
jgi:hypothetical protein